MVKPSLSLILAASVAAFSALSGCANSIVVHRPQLSKAEVRQIADAKALETGYNPVNYMRNGPNYDDENDAWSVEYWLTSTQQLLFSVEVRDKTRQASIAISEHF